MNSVNPDVMAQQLLAEHRLAKNRGTAFDIVDRAFCVRLDWVRTIKTVRQVLGLNLYEAQRLVLQHKGWRRLAAERLRSDRRCQLEGWAHVRECLSVGLAPLVAKSCDHYRIVVEPTR